MKWLWDLLRGWGVSWTWELPTGYKMRTVTITRQPSTEWGTFGDLDTGIFHCKTLERPATGDHPCIPLSPEGGWTVDWTDGVHPKHPQCFEVRVAGRTAILIHSANVYEQLLGCIAPGSAVEVVELDYEGHHICHRGVIESKATLAKLIADLGKDTFKLIVKESI